MTTLKAILVLVVLILLTALSPPTSAQSGTALSDNRIWRLIKDAAVPNGLGVNIHDHSDDDLDLVAAMGFRLVRTDVSWSKIERRPGVYDWTGIDSLVARTLRRGLVPLLILAYSNPLYAATWKGDSGRLDWAYEPPVSDPARNAYVAFAQAAAARYSSAVIWEIWNEPDLTFGKPPKLDAYLRLAAEACRAMRRVQPEVAIIGPATSGFPMGFLQDFVRSDRDGCFDAVSVHPYRDSKPESALRDWQRLDEVMQQTANARGKVAIDSEWGYSVQGGKWSEQRQAEYVTRLYLTDLLAGVPITIIYDLRNDGPDPQDKEQNFGLFDSAGKPKLVAGMIAGLLQDLRGFSLLGRARTASDDALVVAFGRPDGALKLVGWSQASRAARVRLGPDLCLGGRFSSGPSCDPGDARIAIEATTMAIDGQPTVYSVPAVRCSTPGKTAAALVSWCQSQVNKGAMAQ